MATIKADPDGLPLGHEFEYGFGGRACKHYEPGPVDGEGGYCYQPASAHVAQPKPHVHEPDLGTIRCATCFEFVDPAHVARGEEQVLGHKFRACDSGSDRCDQWVTPADRCNAPASAHIGKAKEQEESEHDCSYCQHARRQADPAQPPRQEEQPKPHQFKGYGYPQTALTYDPCIIEQCYKPKNDPIHAAPPAQDGGDEHVVEMYLCEIPWLILKPQAYRFSAHPDCEKCAEYQNPKGATAEPPQDGGAGDERPKPRAPFESERWQVGFDSGATADCLVPGLTPIVSLDRGFCFGAVVAQFESKDDAEAVVRAHRALSGIADPEGWVAGAVQVLDELCGNANRLCDRQLGGTYEEDCRRSIAAARAFLGKSSLDHTWGAEVVELLTVLKDYGANALLALEDAGLYGVAGSMREASERASALLARKAKR